MCVDFTLATASSPVKMRLGGIVHAARGLWAADIPYSVAAVCPEYLRSDAEDYLKAHGCSEFIRLGTVLGAPNLFLIGDVREVGHQGYEDILRDRKTIQLLPTNDALLAYRNIVLFPGGFSLESIAPMLHQEARIVVDVACGIPSIEALQLLGGRVHSLAISTSSELFLRAGGRSPSPLISDCQALGARFLLLKENRGGSRLFDLGGGTVERLPAVLSTTVNSVGVGDVFTAIYAAWQGTD